MLICLFHRIIKSDYGRQYRIVTSSIQRDSNSTLKDNYQSPLLKYSGKQLPQGYDAKDTQKINY